MKRVAVVGAGIVGLATAYELLQKGFDVTVYEAGGLPGQQTSKANGGQLSYSFVSPLASPDVLRSLHRLLLDRHGALRLRPRFDVAQMQWLLGFIAMCSAQKHREGAEDLLSLGVVSREALAELLHKHPLQFDHNENGKLQVFESRTVFEATSQAQTAFLRSHGVEQLELGPQEAVRLEPSLAPIEQRIVGALFTPSEQAGNCELLCLRLSDLLQSFGVELRFNAPITSLRRDAQGQLLAFHHQEPVDADAVVLANGTAARALAKPLGLDLGIYPLRGYSLTYPIDSNSGAPVASVSDIRNKVVYARMGDRLRVAGMIDIGVDRPREIDARIQTLKNQVKSFFPALRPIGPATGWSGVRSARPTSKPLIGPTPVPGLFVNVGQGALGFTLAFGSARLLAESIDRPQGSTTQLASRFAM